MHTLAFPASYDADVQEKILNVFLDQEMVFLKIFRYKASKRRFEKVAAYSTLAAMPEKAEGAKWPTDDPIQRFTYEVENKTYALAFPVTEEMVEDDEQDLVDAMAMSIAMSAWETLHVNAANILNRAFNSSYVYGDGKELCATDHPTAGGTASNELTTPADLANSSLDEARYTMQNTVDHRGKMLRLVAKRLIVPSQIMALAEQITDSQYEYNAASGALNKNFFRGRLLPVELPYLTDTDAWFIQADEHHMRFNDRVSYSTGKYVNVDTGSLVHYGRMRNSFGVGDWRGIFGTAGAA